ncbi:MAG: hypothetical protein IPP31_04790 [Chitinophagaceae bacterium]|nr:hypothetical protein [Chitinophagaceae bacterium]
MKKIFLGLLISCSMKAAVAQTTLGLVAYWPMDGNYIDYWTNAIHGTNAGSTPTTNSGMANRAMQFLNRAPQRKYTLMGYSMQRER